MADLKNALAKKAGSEVVKPGETKDTAVALTVADSFQSFLEKRKGELAKALPSHVTIDRVLRIAVAAVARNPKLAACTQQSLIAGVVISSQLGLELNTPLGHAWLIPYDRSENRNGTWVKVPEAQFQLGYQGIIDLAYRTEKYNMIYAEEVYTNDRFSYSYGFDKHLEHVPCEDEDRGELRGIYAVYHLKSGGKDFKYWSVGKITAHAMKYSKSWDEKNKRFQKNSAWADSFEGMARVPVLKDLLKLAPKSIEFARQITLDGTTKGEIIADMSTAHEIDYQPPNVGQITDADTGEVSMSDDEKKDVTDTTTLLQEVYALITKLAEVRGDSPDDTISSLTNDKLSCLIDLEDKPIPYLTDIKLMVENELQKGTQA